MTVHVHVPDQQFCELRSMIIMQLYTCKRPYVSINLESYDLVILINPWCMREGYGSLLCMCVCVCLSVYHASYYIPHL